jgi:nitrogen regulatory protein PII
MTFQEHPGFCMMRLVRTVVQTVPDYKQIRLSVKIGTRKTDREGGRHDVPQRIHQTFEAGRFASGIVVHRRAGHDGTKSRVLTTEGAHGTLPRRGVHSVFLPKTKIEIAVDTGMTERIIETITQAARTR